MTHTNALAGYSEYTASTPQHMTLIIRLDCGEVKESRVKLVENRLIFSHNKGGPTEQRSKIEKN